MKINHLREQYKLLTFVLGIFLSFSGISQSGLKGIVTNTEGEPLPFAGIFLPAYKQGVASNVEGHYTLELSPGTYRLRIQYLGYRQLDTTLTIGTGYLQYNPVLQPEFIRLAEATVKGSGEDPAYTIMRRAIAKAKYHSMQVDEYHAMVYVKGSGRLLKVPALFRKQINKALAEEGIDSTVAFTQESVSKLHYIRPDQYRDTVVSIRTTGDDRNTSPMNFIYSSFYEPKVVAGISPLAPDAFAHYRFEYLGYIESGQHVINKIKVIPKGKGDNVYEGNIYIVDDVWSIHSLDLTTYIWGIKFEIQQQFDPILPDVWLPVHEIYDVSGSVFGFGFEYRYFARLSDYDLRLNPDLDIPVVVIDEKIVADKNDIQLTDKTKITALDPGEELSARQLRKMLKEYEKQEIEALPEVDTVAVAGSKQVIDSTAYEKDSTYWEDVRPMPLTDYEERGYARMDSIAALPPDPDDDNEDQDTVQLLFNEEGFSANVKRRDKFSLLHLVTGGRYSLGNHFLQMKGLLQTIQYNTVDGFHGGYEFLWGNQTDQKLKWETGPSIKYNEARNSFNYTGQVRLYTKTSDFQLTGGKQTRQFSYDYPISPWANTIYSLLVNRNYLKEYEQDFIAASYDHTLPGGIRFGLQVEYAERMRLVNHTDIVFFDDKDLLFTSNDPAHVEGDVEVFNDHTALISDLSLHLKPVWKYIVANGTKRKDYNQSPEWTIRYRRGWGEENDPFDLVAAAFRYKMPVGAGSLWNIHLQGGTFVGDGKPRYFHDFVHFPGNLIVTAPSDPAGSFRMLDYYLFSTREEYFFGIMNYQFRRLLLTQFDYFQRKGIRENLILNALFTPESKQYMEAGYAINYLFRFMRLEFVTSWQDLTYKDFAVRVGIATDFQSLFGF